MLMDATVPLLGIRVADVTDTVLGVHAVLVARTGEASLLVNVGGAAVSVSGTGIAALLWLPL